MTYAYRFQAYAASQGISPDAVLERDSQEYPGGKMAGYITWLDEQWRTWHAQTNRRRGYILSPADHEDFDRFLGELGKVTA